MKTIVLFLLFMNSVLVRAETIDLNLNPVDPFFGRGMTKEPTEGPTFAATLDKEPLRRLKPDPKNEGIRVYKADLNGDGKDEYIVIDVTKEKLTDCQSTVRFYSSDFRTRFCADENFLTDGFDYIHFFRPKEKSSSTFMISLSGSTDHSNFQVYKLEPNTLKPDEQFSFEAFIPSQLNGKASLAWGYPWDINGLIVDPTGKKIKVGWAANTKDDCLPKLFFSGAPTQGSSIEKQKLYQNASFSSLADITKKYSDLKKANSECNHRQMSE